MRITFLLLVCVSSFSNPFKSGGISNILSRLTAKSNKTKVDPKAAAAAPAGTAAPAPDAKAGDTAAAAPATIDASSLVASKPDDTQAVDGNAAGKKQVIIADGDFVVNGLVAFRCMAILSVFGLMIHLSFQYGILNAENFKYRMETLALCVVNIAVTAALLLSNKWLMSAEVFPHPIELAFIHTLTALSWATWSYGWYPDQFPSFDAVIEDPIKAVKDVGIVTLFQSANVAFSNTVLMYAPVAFVQLCKALKVAMIYLLSVTVGSERFEINKAQLVTLIAFCGMTAVYKETSVSAAGVAFALMTSFSDCIRLVMQGVVLCGEKRYDPNTFVFLNALIPVPVFIVLISIDMYNGSGVLGRFITYFPYIAMNACLAASVQIIVPRLISRINGLGYGVFNVIKDSSVLVTAFIFDSDSLQQSQIVSYCCCYCFILVFLLVKERPSVFAEYGLIGGTIAFFTGSSNKQKLVN